MKLLVPLLVGGGILAALAMSGSASAATPSLGPVVRSTRPITVIGDSFAVGIAAALQKLYPGRDIRVHAKVGAQSSSMVTAPDDGSLVIVSAGTNDAASGKTDDAIVQSVVRVLGAFDTGAKNGGALYYVMPHDKMGGTIGVLVDRLDSSIMKRYNDRAQFNDPDMTVANGPMRLGAIRPTPTAPDKIHFDMAGYTNIAQHAMAYLEPFGASNSPTPGPAPDGATIADVVGLKSREAAEPGFVKAFYKSAKALQMDPDYLAASVSVESGFNPQAQNPSTGASGLIQWMPQYAGLCGGIDALRAMSATEQLPCMVKTLSHWKDGLPPQDVYLGIFYPALVGKPDDSVVFEQGSDGYTKNSGLDVNHDGKITAGDVRTVAQSRLNESKKRPRLEVS